MWVYYGKMVNGKDIFNVHWPNSLGRIEGFCTVCEQLWVDLNPWPFAQKATTLTTAQWRPHTIFYFYLFIYLFIIIYFINGMGVCVAVCGMWQCSWMVGSGFESGRGLASRRFCIQDFPNSLFFKYYFLLMISLLLFIFGLLYIYLLLFNYYFYLLLFLDLLIFVYLSFFVSYLFIIIYN